MSNYKKEDLEVLKYAMKEDAVKTQEAIATALQARIVNTAKERFS